MALWILGWLAPAQACTLCHSETAVAVRELVLAGAWSDGIRVAAPLPLLAGVVYVLSRASRGEP